MRTTYDSDRECYVPLPNGKVIPVSLPKPDLDLPMSPNSETVMEIMRLLGLPPNVQSFMFTAGVGEIPSVTCTFHPAEKNATRS